MNGNMIHDWTEIESSMITTFVSEHRTLVVQYRITRNISGTNAFKIHFERGYSKCKNSLEYDIDESKKKKKKARIPLYSDVKDNISKRKYDSFDTGLHFVMNIARERKGEKHSPPSYSRHFTPFDILS